MDECGLSVARPHTHTHNAVRRSLTKGCCVSRFATTENSRRCCGPASIPPQAKPAGEGEAPPPPVVPRSSPLNRSQWLDLQGMRDLIRDLSIIDRDFQEMPVNNVAHCDGMVDDKNRYTNILPSASVLLFSAHFSSPPLVVSVRPQ